jgi:hypothetical protein
MTLDSDPVRTRKNSRFKIFKRAIRIFVPPKNERIYNILPDVIKEMKGGFFLNLLSQLFSADVATLPAYRVGRRSWFCSLRILFHHKEMEAGRVTKSFL